MSAQLTHEGTVPQFSLNATSRATLQTRPWIQRIMIRSWEYIPAVRGTILTLRMLAVLVLTITGITLLSNHDSWGWLSLGLAVTTLPVALWVFTTAAKGWPRR
jgi:hypothetical protein